MNLFIIASGLSLIFGVLRVINFAHGAFYMFGAYILYSVAESYELGFWTGVVAAAAGLAAMSIVIERGLFRFIYDKEHLMQLLLTFAVVLILTRPREDDLGNGPVQRLLSGRLRGERSTSASPGIRPTGCCSSWSAP